MRPTRITRNRVVSAIIVGGAHVFVLWLIRNAHYARESVVEEFGSIFFFSPGATVSSRAPRPQKPVRHLPPSDAVSQDSSELASAPPSGMPLLAASSAPAVQAPIDWQQTLDSVAIDVIERAKADAARYARLRAPQQSASFDPLYQRPRDFDWISQHSRLVINAEGVPEWVLIQPCAVIIFVEDPDCTVEHVERHGITLEYIQQRHDANLGYGGPDAVP
jgi:hypothetical protein